MISIVVGAMRTATPASWHRSTRSNASSLREVGVGDDHLVHAVPLEQPRQVLEPPRLRSPLSGFGVSEM